MSWRQAGQVSDLAAALHSKPSQPVLCDASMAMTPLGEHPHHPVGTIFLLQHPGPVLQSSCGARVGVCLARSDSLGRRGSKTPRVCCIGVLTSVINIME